jgi:hypothetical protein
MTDPKTPAPESDVAALVGDLRTLATPERAKHGVPQDVAMLKAAETLESLSSKVKEAGEPGAVAIEALRAYEAWEADVILNADWSGDLPTLTQHQWDWLVDIQSKRYAALLPAAALKGEAVSGDDIVYLLKAMATNYSGGHSWDHLDGEACMTAFAELTRLREALAAETKARETAETERDAEKNRQHREFWDVEKERQAVCLAVKHHANSGTPVSYVVREKMTELDALEATITTLRAELAKAREAKGPWRAEFGALIHEDHDGFVFTVSPASCAEDVAKAMNARTALTSISDGAPKGGE